MGEGLNKDDIGVKIFFYGSEPVECVQLERLREVVEELKKKDDGKCTCCLTWKIYINELFGGVLK